jgi:hypothetical protein
VIYFRIVSYDPAEADIKNIYQNISFCRTMLKNNLQNIHLNLLLPASGLFRANHASIISLAEAFRSLPAKY